MLIHKTCVSNLNSDKEKELNTPAENEMYQKKKTICDNSKHECSKGTL